MEKKLRIENNGNIENQTWEGKLTALLNHSKKKDLLERKNFLQLMIRLATLTL